MATPTTTPPDAIDVERPDVGDVLEQTPLPGTTPAPSAADPADVVRALLDALDAEDFPTQRALTAGPARILMRIRDVIRDENTYRGGTTSEEIAIDEPPVTIEQDERSATVSMDATLRSTVSGDEGEPVVSTDRLQGPVELRRADGRWFVTTMVYDEGPLVGERLDASQTRETIRLEVPAMLSYETTTGLLARFVPTAEEGMGLAIRSAHLRVDDDRELATKVFAIERQSTPVLFFGFERVDDRPTGVRVEVERTDTGTTWTYDVRF